MPVQEMCTEPQHKIKHVDMIQEADSGRVKEDQLCVKSYDFAASAQMRPNITGGRLTRMVLYKGCAVFGNNSGTTKVQP